MFNNLNQKYEKNGKNASYEQEVSQKRMAQLHDRFADKSFCEGNRWLKWIAYSGSWMLNIFSLIGASYGVYWLCSLAIPYPVIAILITIVILTLWEISKRKSSDKVWDTVFAKSNVPIGWVGFSVLLFAGSYGMTALGLYQGTQDFAPEAALIQQDSTTRFLQSQLATNTDNIDRLKKTTWKGKITRKSQAAIDKFAVTQNQLLAQVNDRMAFINNSNEQIKSTHQSGKKNVAQIALFLVLALELLFEMCIAFCSYFDFREYCENKIPAKATVPNQVDKNFFRNIGTKSPEHSNQFTNHIEIDPFGLKARYKNRPEPVAEPTPEPHTQVQVQHAETLEDQKDQLPSYETVFQDQLEKDPETYIIERGIDLTKIKRNCRNGWKRFNNNKDQESIKYNQELYQQSKSKLEKYGFQVIEKTLNSLEIISPTQA